jgi:hypothetical protein
MATISNTPRPGYIWDATDNVWYPIGVGAHQHTNAADTPAVMPYSTYAAAGKNKIFNGDFAINQRAFSSTSNTNAYSFDRWYARAVGDGTVTHSLQTFTPGTAPVTGYEGINYARIVTSGQTSTVTNAAMWRQYIEDVRTFAGQTITVSFWAKAASGTPFINTYLLQASGTGGSGGGSAIGTKQAITTSWARYSFTVNVPSLSGVTIGTSSSLLLSLVVSAGTNFLTDYFIQNNTFDIWGVQVEAGSTATAFQTATGTLQGELAACQRYYYRSTGDGTNAIMGAGIVNDATSAYIQTQLPVSMRVAPTSVEYSTLRVTDRIGINTAITSVSLTTADSSKTIAAFYVVASGGGMTANRPIFMSAQGSTAAYLGLSAEL